MSAPDPGILHCARAFMIRLGFMLVAVSASSAVPASQGHVVHRLKGVTVTETLSVLAPCGKDLVISVSDGDQYFVIIEYNYNGTYPYIAGSPMRPVRETRSGAMNVSVGPFTTNGTIVRVHADTKGLICDGKWDFNMAAFRADNISQMKRDRAADLQRKKEQELAAINRKKEEIAAGKLKSQEMMNHLKRLEEAAAAKRLADYRKASPENSRCIINEPADIGRCEQWKARMRAEKQRQDASAARLREIDAARQHADSTSAEGVARAARDMQANNCSYVAGAPTIPVPANATAAEVKRIDAMNWEISQKFFRETRAANDACDLQMGMSRACLLARQDAVRLDELKLQAGKAPSAYLKAVIGQLEQHYAIVKAECTAAQNTQPTAQNTQPAAVQAQTINAPLIAPQMKSGAPSSTPVTVTAPTGNADVLKNDNAQLRDMINNLK